jgi:hypothetical protein
LILSLVDNNWQEWSRRMTLLADRLHVRGYLDGNLTCPDLSTHQAAHHIWEGSDRSLRAFMLERVSPDEYDVVSKFDTSHAVFEALRNRHENPGLHAQISLLLKVLDIRYERDIPMEVTTREIRKICDRITKIGPFDNDKLLTFFIIKSLGRHFPQLQASVHNLTLDPNFSSGVAVKRVLTEAHSHRP